MKRLKEFPMKIFKTKNAENAFYIGTLCSISYLAVYFARNILSAVSPEILADGVFDTEFLGNASSVYFVFYAVGQLINGLIGNKVPAKFMIGLGLLLAGSANLTFVGFSDISPAASLASYAVTGFFLSMIYAPMTKVIAENTDPIYAPRCSLGYTFSEFLGSPLAGVSAAFLAWQSVFYIGSVFLAVMGCAIFTAFTIFEKKGVISKKTIKPTEKSGGKLNVLFKRGIVKFTFISIITGVVRTSVVFWMPTYISSKLGFAPEKASLIFTVSTFIIAFSTFVSIFVYEKIGRNMEKTILIMFSASSVFFLLLFFAESPILNIAFLCLAIMASNGSSSMMWARYCPSLRDTGMVSGVTGYLDFISYISAAVSSSLFAGAVDSIGWNNLILIWMGLMVFGVIINLPYKKLSKKFKN